MKIRDLTPKQQAKAAAKVFRILKDMGFQRKERAPELGDYWWRKVPNQDKRVCVGLNLWNHCFGGRNNGWMWQTTNLNEEPAFGYSGTLSCNAGCRDADQIIDLTLERFLDAGVSRGVEIERMKTTKAKAILANAMEALS